ncbi:MAG: hypothetical protein QM702_02480 [Rubrivivax sp.]
MPHDARRSSARVAAIAAALALLGTTAWADPPARVGRVAWTAGDVTLAPQAGAAASNAALNWPVTTGNVLVTGPSGRAEVTIGATAFDLDVGTEVDVEQLDDDQMRLRVVHGSVALRTRDRQDAAMLALQSPLGRFTLAQPGSLRVDVRNDGVHGTAWHGRVEFVAGDGSRYSFAPGQHARLSASPGGAVAMNLLDVGNDDFKHFVQARAGGHPAAATSHYVSPAMTGAEGLDAYGRWESSADGAIWVPDVPANWAPYRYGRWAWVEPWGWTWVDDAPWGFAPFHYGRWTLWGDRWAWVPGTYVARPVYAPAMVAWTGAPPPAPSVSASVTIGIGATVGWVPLAPREVYVPPYAVSATYIRQVNITHVTNVTEIQNVTRVVTAGRQRGAVPQPPVRPLAFAGNPRAATTVQAQVLQTQQPVVARLAAAAPHEPAVPHEPRPAHPHPPAHEGQPPHEARHGQAHEPGREHRHRREGEEER